jgi:acetyl-CoA acyltransferase
VTGVVVAGVGMHPFGKHEHLTLKDLARVATLRALDDAGLGVKRIGAAYCSNALAGLLQGQEMVRGQTVLRDCGIDRVPIVNVENACAGGSTALAQAVMDVRSGAHDVVLAVGYEKMFVSDLTATLDALETGADIDVVGGLGIQFTAIYAMRLRRLIAQGLLDLDDLVDVSVKSHENGALNPYAQHRRVVTADQVRESRAIADPLTLLMCSSICDGAAAVVVAREGLLPRLNRPTVRVTASQSGSGFDQDSEGPSLSAACASRAYEEAGLAPADIDIAEVHDAMAPAELLYTEQLGFCAPGEGAQYFRSGATRLDGVRPINTSGGLSSRGHPVGATGLAQIVELVWQLRGEAGARQMRRRPRNALAQNSGGWLEGESAAANVHILQRKEAWD